MTNQRFHIDLGSSIIINRIYYENGHASGGSTLNGVKDFTLWGSNTAADFADLTYANNGTWTQITGVSQSTFDQHIAADQADPKYITVSNTTAYRYYAFKFAGTWGVSTYMSVRKLVLQYGTPSSRRGIILNDGSNLVSGRIPFATTNGRLMDSSSLNWDVANNRLGIGTAAPLVKLHVLN